jgi:hypothetical protein
MSTTKYNLEYYYDEETSSIKIVDRDIITVNKGSSFKSIYEEPLSGATIFIDWRNGNMQKSTTRNDTNGTTILLLDEGISDVNVARYTLILQKGSSLGYFIEIDNDSSPTAEIFWPYGHPNSFYAAGNAGNHMIITFTYANGLFIGVPTPWIEHGTIFLAGDSFFNIAGL